MRSYISSRSLLASTFLAFLPRAIRVWAFVYSAKSRRWGSKQQEKWLDESKQTVISLAEIAIFAHQSALRMGTQILVLALGQ